MWTTLRHLRSLKELRIINGDLKRLFMSESFSCTDAWTSRLKSPILQKASGSDLFFELENKFAQNGRVSAIDIDIFVNSLNAGDHLDELEDLVHKLRLSSESSNMLDSTSHAFIRFYLEYGEPDELLRILNDRLNYGIFPDKFCCILLMDHFINKGDFCKASKIATLQMLQEDFPDDLVKYLSLFSCHNYLLNPTEWEKPEELQPEPDDEEEVRVRVKYLRNPYFDDHFDLKDPNQLIGKSLLLISDLLDDPISINYKLLGLILRNDKSCEKFIVELIDNKKPLYLSIVELAEEIINRQSNQSKEVKESEGNSQVDTAGIKKVLQILKEGNKCSSENILGIVENKIKNLVAENEKSFIDEQIKIYEDWENKREETLKNELDALNKRLILRQIEEKKEELKKKEDELFFFEREDELDLIIEKKKFPSPAESSKVKSGKTDDDYIPPEITKQKNKIA